MKFEIELIEGGRCIIPMEGNTGLIVADDDLGATLRGIQDAVVLEKPKAPAAKKTRSRRTRAQIAEDKAKVEAPAEGGQG